MLLAVFCYRIYVVEVCARLAERTSTVPHAGRAQGFYIVTYGLGIYLLNLLIAFLSPQVDPAQEELNRVRWCAFAAVVGPSPHAAVP